MRLPGKKTKQKYSTGSALILAVVLSSLLAIVGVLFVMMARINKMSTSAISENMELNFAVDTVLAEISQQLVLDIPGITDKKATEPNSIDPNEPDPNLTVSAEEYYDYPDVNNLWLASLEPYKSQSEYYWRQISDITGQLTDAQRNIRANIVSEYEPIVDSNAFIANADADGDGVGDSKWVKLNEITSGQGKSIYTAVRIVDNGAMLNVNTGYQFEPGDPNTALIDVDGSSQIQINIMALAGRPGDPPTRAEQISLLQERANQGVGVNLWDKGAYVRNVIWSYGDPNGSYTPFDISDELELRYRFLLNHTDIDTRLETWSEQFRSGTLSTPVTSGGQELDAWFLKAAGSGDFDPNYTYRHIATTYNMDRIINPAGAELNNGKMVNVNTAQTDLLYAALRAGLRNIPDPNSLPINELAAQLAVNIIDHRDPDTNITTFPVGPKIYYGLEAQPFISEMAFRISAANADDSSNNNFAIELYNPFEVDIPLGDFNLELRDVNEAVISTITLTGYVIAAQSRFVVTNSSDSSSQFGLNSLMAMGGGKQDPNLVLATYSLISADPPAYELSERYDICLLRKTLTEQLYLDKQVTQDDWFNWNDVKDSSKFYCRDDNNGNYVYQNLSPATNTLGAINGTNGTRKNYNITNSIGSFISAGEIARILTIAPSPDPNDMIGMKLELEPPEGDIRVDLQNPVFSSIFQYLTVIDPAVYGLPIEETRIKGRININTAPWFVMAQLPWMLPEVAQEVVAYRDAVGAFESIGKIMYVPLMGFYAYDPSFSAVDLDQWPDLTPADGAISDFEERDVIFSRISNLVTVRSDVFTAYILVRIGIDGPQRRVIAILDRSQVNSTSDKVRIIAVHPVPDPR